MQNYQGGFLLKINEVLKHFGTEKTKLLKSGEYLTFCPAHDDKHPSLYIREDDKTGNILLKCQAGCSTENIVDAAGLKMKDLFSSTSYSQSDIHYYYCDEKNVQVARIIRHINPEGRKSFSTQRFENGNWINGLDGMKLPLYNLPALVNSHEETIYIVEGEKDVESMQELGFVATTPPFGASAKWEPRYNKYFKYKNVVIIADNDEAGEKHAKKIATNIINIAESIKVISAEEIYCYVKEGGDISDIIGEWPEEAKFMIQDAVECADYFSAPKSKITNDIPVFCYPNKNGGMSVNSALLAEHFKNNKTYKIVKNSYMQESSCFYLYDKGKYSPVSDDVIKSILIKYITEYDISILKMSNIKETIDILKTDDNYILSSEFDKNETFINLKNGLLNLETMQLVSHSPDILTTIQIDAEWCENEIATPVFDRFINTLTNNNEDIKSLLLTTIGLCISCVPGYRTKKSLFLVGEGNTGKTRLKMLTERILGEEFCCSLDLKDLESRFGPSMLMGKRLAGSADLSFGTTNQLKIFKQLVGGDTIAVEKKFQNISSYRFDGFLWYCSNTMPFFGGDKGDWVYDRFIIVPCNNVVPEDQRNPFIVDEMFEERNGIVQKAVKHLKFLINNNYKFDIPKVCNNALNEHKKHNSPAIIFFEECCVMRESNKSISSSDKCTMTTIRRVFNAWCKDNIGKSPYSTTDFESEIISNIDTPFNGIRTRTSAGRYYIFTLNEETMRDYGHILTN